MKMKTKRCGARVFSMVAAAVVLAVGILSGCQKNDKISLKDLKTGDEYQYAKAMWNTSAQEVEKSLPFSIVKDAEKIPEGNTGKSYVPYKSEKTVTVDGMKAVANFEFYEDQVKYIRFIFETPENGYKEQFEKQVERLVKQFGPESKKMDNSGDGFQSTVYRWETENTAMQIALMTGEEIYPVIQLSVSHLSLLEDKYRDMPHQ